MANVSLKDEAHTAEFYDRFRRFVTRGLPKYAQFREVLIAAIQSGYWKPGEKLPTELEFAQMGPFSLGTVQRALRTLSEEGIVVRRQGLGSFVAESRKRMEDPWHCRFLNDSGDGYLPVYSKSINRERTEEPGPWTHYLGQPRGGVLRIDRQIDISDEFTVFSRFFADPVLLKPLIKCPMAALDGANFKTLIARECHLPITQITHDLRMMTFDAEIGALIHTTPESPGLFIQAVARAGRDICVYYQEFFVPYTTRSLRFVEVSRRAEE